MRCIRLRALSRGQAGWRILEILRDAIMRWIYEMFLLFWIGKLSSGLSTELLCYPGEYYEK